LEARLPGEAAEAPARRVAIIGAGIAGAATARAVRALGSEAVVIEADRPGAGSSGNPAALVTPRLDAGLGDAARLFAQAFGRAVQLYGQVPGAVLSQGVLQLAADARDADRFARVAVSDIFEPDALALLDAETGTARLGEPAPVTLDQGAAQVVAPAPILAAWIGQTLTGAVAAIEPDGDGWRLLDADGAEMLRADAVILTAGLASRDLNATVPLQPVRGQASWTDVAIPTPTAAWGGYVVSTPDGLLFGATHDRDDADTGLRDEDHARNLASLATALPALAAQVAGRPLQGRASVRAVTPDRTPIAGQVAPGLFALTGFGSRGFSLAPLLAEHVAALALGAPSPIDRAQADLVAPDRFARRAARRRS
ncbi:MAG: FAD-dependent 5-carboxymethylaminomethyl-2-thiouridine(34) oxidoreductase MnmC, partial [Alphaproteobacteria bacterium]|nr:FAD-dependent 5-carboxymethylaminomethyl-2-thiouridine(34) oxidoreductase MnmC [Alphaproteobacteria bacterium]MBU2307966.1 FAD-dependent 5-carboxymethylaminomethyl-2-thiouridine(34) oxidoreductase MnmC [Alphaproteobacteria bacterium]